MDMMFNDIDFTPYLKVENIRRDILPPRSIFSKKIPGRLGHRFIKVEMEPRTIEVDVRLIERNRKAVQEKVRQIAGMLHTTEPKKLILRDEPTRYNIAILSESTDIEKFVNTGFATLRFLCLDPLSYSIEKNIIQLGQSTTIYNKGTFETTGTINININNNTNYLEVLLVETGEKIYIEDNLTTGDKILINLQDEYVKKNDVLIMDKLHIISDFFELPVGKFTIKLSSGTGTLEFREVWL